jgi:aminoglycoside phosphotransferase (APT) family kinase protein
VTTVHDHLTPRQTQLLASWLPGATVTKDHSWGLVASTVLELRTPDGASYIAKAGDENAQLITAEIEAHRNWLAPWTSRGHAPTLVNADPAAQLLLTTYRPGELVQGTEHEHLVDTYRQAGELLARFHGQLAHTDDGAYEARQKESTLAWLNRPHRIDPAHATTLADIITAWPTPASVVVPTHGDWQPRNWLVHHNRIAVIDFGRAALRPPLADFGRLAVQQFRTDPALEQAFLQGYGPDPREPQAWLRQRIREAVGTAAWAYQVGEESFEQQGHRMIADVIADLQPP